MDSWGSLFDCAAEIDADERAVRDALESVRAENADRQGLEDFVGTMNPRPEEVICVHGDEASTDQFSSGLYQEFGMRTYAPRNLETFRFD